MALGANSRVLTVLGSPARSEQILQSSLPAQITPLLGREKEVRAAIQLLQRGDVRLVTLTGPGGVGKTRLSLEIGAELLDDFATGVHFLPLATVTNPDLVASAIVQALLIRESSSDAPLTLLKEYFAGKQALLLLDNFEQVIPAGIFVAELLAASPGLKVLVTSRSPLRVRGEHELHVPPLDLPDKKDLADPAALARSAAVELFVQRGTAANPSFALTPANAATVAEICARLDGLPLAIELAAVRIKLLAPKALLARLDHRLTLLVGGAADLPTRQRTLRNTIDWSYGLLSADEQRLFRRMAIFAGGGTVEAAEAICDPGGAEQAAALELLGSLLDKSLLNCTQPGQQDEEPRLGMLETIREYALEQLIAHDELAALRERHSAYYLRLAETLEPDLTGPRQVEQLDRLEIESDNIRLDLGWAIERDAADVALRFCNALWRYWRARGYLSEGRRWLQLTLALPYEPATSDAAPPAGTPEHEAIFRLAQALNAAGVLVYEQGDYEAAWTLHTQSLAIARRLNRRDGIAASVNNLGLVARGRGDYQQARNYYEESLRIRREDGDPRGVSISSNNLGVIAEMMGDYAGARNLYEESLLIRRGLGDERGIAMSLNNLGNVMMQTGVYDRAQELQEESLALQQRIGNKWGIASALASQGEIAIYQGRYEQARRHFIECSRLRRDLGDKEGFADCLLGLGIVAARQEQPEHAARLLGAEEALREALGAPPYVPETLRIETVAALRSRLGGQLYELARTFGRATPPEEVLAVAERDADQEAASAAPQIVAFHPIVAKQATLPPTPTAIPFPAGLTEREVDVLRLVAQGLSNNEVGVRLTVSRLTVSAHLRSIYSKLGVSSRTAAARFAVEHNLT